MLFLTSLKKCTISQASSELVVMDNRRVLNIHVGVGITRYFNRNDK